MHTASPMLARIGTVPPWYKQRWPWLLMAGPGAVVVAASFTCWLAFTRQDALVVDDYYAQGQAINTDLRRASAASALGLSFACGYDAATGTLRGRLLSFGKPVAGKILIRLIHSTRPEKDLALEAQLDPQGQFGVGLPMLEQARWQVQVEGAGRAWRLDGDWKWPQQRTVAIGAGLAPAE